MSGSNRTDQLLQHVMVPKISTYTSNGRTQYRTLVNLSNIDTITASNLVVSTAQFTNTEVGTADGNLILGLGANPSSNSNTIQGGTTAVGVETLVGASNVSDNLFMGYRVASNAYNVGKTVALGPYAGRSISNMQGCVYVGANSGENLLYPPGRTDYNVVVGYNAGRFQGKQNVLVGAFAGETLSGNGNVFVGQSAGSAVTSAMNTFVLANSSTAGLLQGQFPNAGNSLAQLGVGKYPNPGSGSNALDVSGDIAMDGKLTVSGSSFGATSNTVTVDVRRGGINVCSGFLTVVGDGSSDICTGQIVVGSNFADASGNYPALVAMTGGLQTVSGQVAVNQPRTGFLGTHQLDVSGVGRITGTLDVGSLLNVSGATVISNTLRVSNATRLCNTLEVASNAAFSTTQSVSGIALFASNVGVQGTLNVSGISLFTSNVGVQGTLNVSGASQFASNVNIAGALSVSSGLTVSSTITWRDSSRIMGQLQKGFNSGGWLALNNSGGINTASLQGDVSNAGALQLADAGGNITMTAFGSNGNISNVSTTSNLIGGVVLSNGNLSNAASSSNSIGGIILSNGNISNTTLSFLHSGQTTTLNNFGQFVLHNSECILSPTNSSQGNRPTIRFNPNNAGVIVQATDFQTGAFGSGGNYRFLRDGGAVFGDYMLLLSNTATPQVWAHSYQNFSDRRMKQNVFDLCDSLTKVNALHPVQFNWKSQDPSHQFGFIAQEVREVIPDIVSTPNTEEEMLGVNYLSMIPFLTKAIQELSAKVAALEAKLG